MKRPIFTIRLEDEQAEFVRSRALKLGVTVTEVMRLLIDEAIRNQPKPKPKLGGGFG
jgi:hypothetical protein